MKQIQLDVVSTRGELAESTHLVHGAVVDHSGNLLAAARDSRLVTYWRSCAKPFQVMPLLESDAFDALGWEDPQLAVACGSHGGEPEHVSLVAAMLADINLEDGDLACGPHDPLSPRGLRAIRDSGEIASRLHNNCSGKHAAMLARAVTAGWPPDGYEKMDHPVQRSIVEMISRWTGAPPNAIVRAVDGCGVPVFGLPLEAMALAYARLGRAADSGEEVPERVVTAMQQHPFLVGGTERFDTVLIEETGGRVIAKVGAEGVHSVCIPEMGIGAAIKVLDGGTRAQHVAIIHLLRSIGVLDGDLPPRLQEFLIRPVRNTRGETVGEVRPLEGTGRDRSVDPQLQH
jgi:L-asparaginase II